MVIKFLFRPLYKNSQKEIDEGYIRDFEVDLWSEFGKSGEGSGMNIGSSWVSKDAEGFNQWTTRQLVEKLKLQGFGAKRVHNFEDYYNAFLDDDAFTIICTVAKSMKPHLTEEPSALRQGTSVMFYFSADSVEDAKKFILNFAKKIPQKQESRGFLTGKKMGIVESTRSMKYVKLFEDWERDEYRGGMLGDMLGVTKNEAGKAVEMAVKKNLSLYIITPPGAGTVFRTKEKLESMKVPYGLAMGGGFSGSKNLKEVLEKHPSKLILIDDFDQLIDLSRRDPNIISVLKEALENGVQFIFIGREIQDTVDIKPLLARILTVNLTEK